MRPALLAFFVLTVVVGVVRATESWYGHAVQAGGTVNSLTTGAAAVRTLIAQRMTTQDKLYNMQDDWKMQLDHNTLLANERRNLQYANNAMTNLNSYYREVKYRNIVRNAQLYAENNAYNASVQFNEAMIKFINQTNFWLDRDTESLDAQNIELLAEIGALRNGNTVGTGSGVRTFGLTRQRQNSVQRKLLNYADWQQVMAESLAMRALKRWHIIQTTRLRGEKNNEIVKNTGLEMHVVTLTAQRNLEQTWKLMETHKKRNMNTRRDNYRDQVPALLAKQLALEANLKTLVIQNARLRELAGEHEEERIDRKKDRDLQKWNYVEALLQRNTAVTYRDKMKSWFETTKSERDVLQTKLAAKTTSDANHMIRLTDCEEENRFLEQHKLVLKQRNTLLRTNCWHVPA